MSVYKIEYKTYNDEGYGLSIREKYFSSFAKAERDLLEFRDNLEYVSKVDSTKRELGFDNKILVRDYQIIEVSSDVVHYFVYVYKLIVD